MPITELGFFRLKPSTSITSPTLLTNLATAAQTCAAYTSRHSKNHSARFRWFHSLTDPSLIYYVGSWGSIAEHKEQFAPSAENAVLRATLGTQVSIDAYFHLDLDQAATDVEGALGGRALAIVTCYVKPGRRKDVEAALRANGGWPRQASAGWRIDREAEDRDELVVFWGLDGGEEVRVGDEVRVHCDRVDVSRASLLDSNSAS